MIPERGPGQRHARWIGVRDEERWEFIEKGALARTSPHVSRDKAVVMLSYFSHGRTQAPRQ